MEIRIKECVYRGQHGVWIAARPVAGEGWHYWRFDGRRDAIAHARRLARDFGGRLRTAEIVPFPQIEEPA